MAENEGRQALSAGKSAAHKFLNMFVMYLLPLGTFMVGLFTGVATWGGQNVVWNALTANSDIQNQHGLISGALFGGIFGIAGYGFWQIDGGTIGKAVGRGFGGYFFGVAVSYGLYAIHPEGVPDGLIDNLVADLKGL
jgi:hypothetical protein